MTKLRFRCDFTLAHPSHFGMAKVICKLQFKAFLRCNPWHFIRSVVNKWKNHRFIFPIYIKKQKDKKRERDDKRLETLHSRLVTEEYTDHLPN